MLKRYGKDKNGQIVVKALVYTYREHGIEKSKLDADAVAIVEKLTQAGFASYIVGGAVRDLLCGKTPKDFDIATCATPIDIKRLFRNSRFIGRRFKIVHVVVQERQTFCRNGVTSSKCVGEKIFEVTTFRSMKDGSTIGNDFGTIEEDVMRRDFTMNALYYDTAENLVIDYVGGVEDIQNHELKPVIPLDRIFSEDPVRMIRAARYACKTESVMTKALRAKIYSSAPLLRGVGDSRLSDEFQKVLNSKKATATIHELMDLGLFKLILPKVSALRDSDKAFKAAYEESLIALDNFIKNSDNSTSHLQGQSKLTSRLKFITQDLVTLILDDLRRGGKSLEEAVAALSSEEIGPSLRSTRAFYHRRKRGGALVVSSFYEKLFAHVYSKVRIFIKPFCPPRHELEEAIRATLDSKLLKKGGANKGERK